MARYFDEHIKRNVKLLDGAWKFTTDENDVGESERWQDGFIGYTITVPSVWNGEQRLLNYDGACWYEKNFYFEGGTLRLNFGAVMTYAKVYLDGEYLGDHYGGFCRFDFIKEGVRKGSHRVTLRVDNSFDEKSIPQTYVDWHHNGGITRSVEAQKLSGISILSNLIDYKITKKHAECSFRAELYNAEPTEITDTVKIYLNGACVAEKNVTLNASERKEVILDGINIEDVRLWSPGSPTLYKMKIESSTDDLFDRVGFRNVETDNERILLNGEPIRFYGVNRHEDFPDFGMAFPPTLMRRDIDIITGAGCNSIRGSHYPNNPIFLDMLDERGIMFWSEIPIWGVGFSTETLGDPDVVERGLKMHKEMVKEYYNHPSILIWGMHNEINSDTEEGYNMTKIYYEYLKANGGNRIVTFATHKPLTDICLELCDIICVNAYYGWYNNEVSWTEFLDQFESRRKTLGISKPVVMSEFGAAALYGYHTFDNIPWTEEYQAKLLSDCTELFLSKEYMAGTFIWQYADARTSTEAGLTRARGFNNKGIVDEYRRPKLAYGAVKAAYAKMTKK